VLFMALIDSATDAPWALSSAISFSMEIWSKLSFPLTIGGRGNRLL
jgi:hypothetical protein